MGMWRGFWAISEIFCCVVFPTREAEEGVGLGKKFGVSCGHGSPSH